jgi:predicted secreted protein
MAYESQGIGIHFSTSSANDTSTAARIEEVISFTGPTGAAGVIDVTHLLSTAKEKLMGLRDEGNISFDINLIATASMQTKVREARAQRTESNVALALTDSTGTLLAMKCYVTGFSISGAVDGKLTGSVTMEINGPVTFTTFTAS